ncbi:unnamed protein product [Cuscuta europaea]|uniref:Uncharacterized protein n=1 Tax=Cuscuta europaea TaxID=41803 RepID=A0A9P0ZC77_CUSEU|nr:unnamed protein product [Cuscuta europaea]
MYHLFSSILGNSIGDFPNLPFKLKLGMHGKITSAANDFGFLLPRWDISVLPHRSSGVAQFDKFLSNLYKRLSANFRRIPHVESQLFSTCIISTIVSPFDVALQKS